MGDMSLSHDPAMNDDAGREPPQPSVELPLADRGVQWRELHAGDLHALSNLIARIEARDNPPYRTSREEVEEMLSEASDWFGIAAFASRGMARGEMVAFMQMVVRQTGNIECLCQGGVDPRFRRIGLGGALVQWQTDAARHVLSLTPYAGQAGCVVTNVDPGNEELEDHLKRLGYHWSRTYYELRAELSDLPPAPDLGSYLRIEEWGPQWEDATRRAANRLNEQEWGRPLTEEQWLMGRTAFVPEWSFVAVDYRGDRPKVAGFLLASRYEQDWAALGWKEGYIDQMGVLADWRHAAVVDALIIATMHAQNRDGMERVGTGLGSANQSSALAVYESLGFRVVGQTRLYALDI